MLTSKFQGPQRSGDLDLGENTLFFHNIHNFLRALRRYGIKINRISNDVVF